MIGLLETMGAVIEGTCYSTRLGDEPQNKMRLRRVSDFLDEERGDTEAAVAFR